MKNIVSKQKDHPTRWSFLLFRFRVKETAPETESSQYENQPSVVSSADGANVTDYFVANLARFAIAEAKTKSLSSRLSACRMSSFEPSHHFSPS